MVNRFRRTCAFALLLVAATAPAGAQDLKIGYVNFDALLRQSPQYQEAAKTFETERARIQSRITAMEQDLQTKQQQLERDAAVMSEADRATLEREIRDLGRDLQRALDEGREELAVRQNEALTDMANTLRQKVAEYGRSEEYDLILGSAYYVDSDYDITESVLETLQ